MVASDDEEVVTEKLKRLVQRLSGLSWRKSSKILRESSALTRACYFLTHVSESNRILHESAHLTQTRFCWARAARVQMTLMTRVKQ